MNSGEVTDIRDLTLEEMDGVSGALTCSFGPIRIKLFQDGIAASLELNGVGAVILDQQGLWGYLGNQGFSLP